MRRLLVALSAIFLLFSTKVVAEDEIIQFPDPYFKKVLVNMYYEGYPKIDLNDDGEIQYSEAAAYTEWLRLDCEGADSITDLTGIKAFINIKKILLERNPLINGIDVSGMVNLEEINFNNDWNLEVLNASGCKNLEKINCSDGKIKHLNVENCIKLKTLGCGNNNLENLNLINCCSLKSFGCYKSNLKNLVFQQCINLYGLNCSLNLLSELDISQMNDLRSITCDNNQLKLLNVRNDNNQSITTFKTFGNPNLKCITVDDPTYSMEHWKEIDEWTEFSEDCSVKVVDNKKNIIKIFPNPANHIVLIERNNIELEDLRILDITGRIFLGYAIPYGETQTQLDVSRLSAGAYIIEINNYTQSLIIE